MHRWLARLLSAFTDPAQADAILGDLEEQRRLRTKQSRVRAGLWFWHTAIGITIYTAFHVSLSSVWNACRSLVRTSWTADARQTLRSLRRTPWYAVTVIGVIGVSMTLATTIFAIVDGVLFKPLPYRDVDQVFAVQPGWSIRPDEFGNFSASPSDLFAWRATAPAVRFAAGSLGGRRQVDEGNSARSADVSEAFFDVLGQQPMLGGFRPEHFTTTTRPTPVILSYAAWQHRFGGDPDILGRKVSPSGADALEIVGVMGPDFLFPVSRGGLVPEAILPLVMRGNEETDRGRGIFVIARTDQPPQALQARLLAATTAVARQFPKSANARGLGPYDSVKVVPLDSALRDESRQTFALVLCAAGLLLLLGCLNVTGLATARTQDRRRELTLRRALGGRRADIVRLLALENSTVLGLGSLIGLLLAWPAVGAVSTLLPPGLVLLKPLAIDMRVLAFVFLAMTACIVVTTIGPVRATLRDDGQGAARSDRGTSEALGRFALVSGQVALALLVVTGGGLVVGSLWKVWQEDPGYRVKATSHLWLSGRGEVSRQSIADLVTEIGTLPAVAAVGGSDVWLLQRAIRGSSFDAPTDATQESDVESLGVTPGFFDATALAPVAGRLPTPEELRIGVPVAVVSARVARDYWHGAPAVGQTLTRRGQPFLIVGVVPDARYIAFDFDPGGTIYFPMVTTEEPHLSSLFVAFRSGASSGLASVVDVIERRFPMFRVVSAEPLSNALSASISTRNFRAVVFGSFSLAAVLITGVGVFGLAAMVAGRRTREIGVRMALGATPSSVTALFVGREVKAIMGGLAAGALAAFWAVRLLQSYLYKMSVYNPVVWVLAAGLILTIGSIGALIPALRASRVDPVQALRVD